MFLYMIAREQLEEKTPLSQKFCAFRCLEFETEGLEFNSIMISEKLIPSQKNVSEGTVSHHALNYEQLSIARYQVSLYADIYFE